MATCPKCQGLGKQQDFMYFCIMCGKMWQTEEQKIEEAEWFSLLWKRGKDAPKDEPMPPIRHRRPRNQEPVLEYEQ